jgi:MFS family permease
MNIIKRIVGLFSVMEEEAISFRLLFLQSLFIGFANSYYYIVSNTFLLKKVQIKYLPNAYIITGIGGYILIQLYKNIQKKQGIPGSVRASLIVFTLLCVLNFFAVPMVANSPGLSVVLAYFMVSFAPPFTAIFSLGVFAQCSRLFNIAQSKRLLALIVSGEIIASVIAFFTVSVGSGLIKGHEYYLLPVAAAFTLLVFVPFNRLVKFKRKKISYRASVKGSRKIDFRFLSKDSFFMLIAIVTLFSVFAIYVIDYAYLVSVRSMAFYTGLEIAQIAAVFLLITKLGELSFSFLSGRILSDKGVKFSVLLLPVILLGCSVLAFLSGWITTGIPIFLLAFLFLGKLADRAIRKSVTTPSIKVMYHVAEPHERLDIEASIDGLLSQVAIIISGVILLVISVFFSADDNVPLLRLFSFVCIVAFILWGFFTLKMYDSYRGKVKDFLAKIKTGIGGVRSTSKQEEVSAQLSEQDNLHINVQVDKALAAIDIHSRDDLFNLVKVYNPRHFMDMAGAPEEKIIKRLSHIYYNNNFYFSRLLIIRYMPYCSGRLAFSFLQDLWEVSDLTCKLELMLAFNELKQSHTDKAFFVRQCEECLSEITWTDAAMFDISSLKDDALNAELKDHRAVLVFLLFELLKRIYEPSVMQVVADIILDENGDLENQLFAVELLDITLDEGLKEMVKLVLEPVSFENKKQKLGKLFHVYSLAPVERLKDILMKDYNMVNLKVRETALIAYNKADGGKNILSAFRTHSRENLKCKAEEFYSGFRSPEYQVKIELIKRLEDSYKVIGHYAPYLFNFGIFDSKKSKANRSLSGRLTEEDNFIFDINVTENNGHLKLDTLAIALLITLKQEKLNNIHKLAVSPPGGI